MTEKKVKSNANKPDKGILLEEYLPYRLAVLANMTSQSVAEKYQERFGLSIAEWRVMANLGRFEPLNAYEVAAKGSLDKARVTRALASMQTKGLILRKPDPVDNRVAVLKLSAKGRRMYEKITPIALAWEEEFLTALDKSEYAALTKILDKLHRKVQKMSGID